MGKSQVTKNLIGIGNLDYVELKNVPMTRFEGHGEAIHADTQAEIEKRVARELILQKIRLRGREVEYLRGIFGLSMRQFAEKLGLTHVAILKWEKAANKPLDLVNEVAVKAMMAGLLGLRLPASLETLVGEAVPPKKWVINFETTSKQKKIA